jgi:hypothetical protein
MMVVLGVGQSEPLRVASPQFPPASNAGDEEIRLALCVATRSPLTLTSTGACPCSKPAATCSPSTARRFCCSNCCGGTYDSSSVAVRTPARSRLLPTEAAELTGPLGCGAVARPVGMVEPADRRLKTCGYIVTAALRPLWNHGWCEGGGGGLLLAWSGRDLL